MMALTKTKIIILVGVLVVLVAAAGIIVLLSNQEDAPETEPVELTYWGVFDAPDVIEPIIEKFEAENPNVTITYVQKDFETYEDDLLDALAEGSGPDIFTLQNTRIPRYRYIISPLPAENTSLIDEYFDVVEKDAVLDGQIYGLPYSVDSLALYYNEGMLQEAGINNPPRTWDEFNDAVQALTEIDASGNFIQAGAALGGSSSTINRPTDILSYFFLQQGTPISDAETDTIALNNETLGLDGEEVDTPGTTGLQEYLKYSKPTEGAYTWNESQNYSFDLFAQEKVAMIFNFAYSLPIVKENAPKQNFKIAPAPQPEGARNKVSFASYWLETVSQESNNIPLAWEFLSFATNTENDKLYSNLSNKPVSRRDLVNDQLNDSDLGAFAEQNIYATSWYQYDPQRMEEIMDTMLKNILTGTTVTDTAYENAVTEMQAVLDEGRSFRIENEERIQQELEEQQKAQQEAEREAQQ